MRFVGTLRSIGPYTAASHRFTQIVIANLRYRSDTGDYVLRSDGPRLQAWGWLERSGQPPTLS